jgi:hypothetical protein
LVSKASVNSPPKMSEKERVFSVTRLMHENSWH